MRDATVKEAHQAGRRCYDPPMGILRIVLGIAVMFGALYFIMMRPARIPPPAPVQVNGEPVVAPSPTATTAPGQTAENMKKHFEAAQQKADDGADEVQKKLDDAVQGK